MPSDALVLLMLNPCSGRAKLQIIREGRRMERASSGRLLSAPVEDVGAPVLDRHERLSIPPSQPEVVKTATFNLILQAVGFSLHVLASINSNLLPLFWRPSLLTCWVSQRGSAIYITQPRVAQGFIDLLQVVFMGVPVRPLCVIA